MPDLKITVNVDRPVDALQTGLLFIIAGRVMGMGPGASERWSAYLGLIGFLWIVWSMFAGARAGWRNRKAKKAAQ